MHPAFARALQLYDLRRYSDAAALLREHLSREPEDHAARTWLSFALSMAGGARESALAEARRAVGGDPDSPQAHHAHALALFNMTPEYPVLGGSLYIVKAPVIDWLEQAAAALKEAIRLDPTCADHFALLAQVWERFGDLPRVLKTAEHGLSLDPNHVGCANLRGEALRRLGRHSESVRHLRETLAIDAQEPFTHLNHAYSVLDAGRHDEALECFREALRLDPDSPYARRGFVAALRRQYRLYRVPLRLLNLLGERLPVLNWLVYFWLLRGVMYLTTSAMQRHYPAERGTGLHDLAVVMALYPFVAFVPLANYLLQWHPAGAVALSLVQKLIARNVTALGAGMFVGILALWFYGRGAIPWLAAACAAAVVVILPIILPPPRSRPLRVDERPTRLAA